MTRIENRPLKFAVMGTGFWSSLQIPAWYEAGNVRCTAVWNRTYEKAVNTAQKYGIDRVYKNPEILLQNEKLDFVDIITEVPAHEELVLLCAKYKVPVICQKPMSDSFKACERMVGACRDAGIPFFIHENWKYRAPFIQLKEILARNPIGKIRRVEFNEVNGGRPAYNIQPFLKQLPHLIITDMGSHVFDIARTLFGEPKSLYCSAIRTYDELAGENFMTAVLNYKDMICHITLGERMDCYLFLDGESGSLTMHNDYRIVVDAEGDVTTHVAPKVREYPWAEHVKQYLPPDHIDNIVACNRSFLRAFSGEIESDNTGEENLKTMKLVYSACESVEKNQVVILS